LYKIVEQSIDKVLITSCGETPQQGDNGQEEYLIVKDPILAHVAANDATLDLVLFGATINERKIRSKIMMATGSTTVNHNSCELFEAMISADIGATSTSKPRVITAESVSKIWKINYPTAARTDRILI